MKLLPAVLSALAPVAAAQATAPLPASAAAPRPRPCAADVHRQFDFWLGQWDVTDPSGKFVGTNRIELVDHGCALSESWSAARGGYTGHSLNSVDAGGRWRQTWVDSGGLRLELVGGLVEGRMVLEGDTPPAAPQGPPTQNRITWSAEPGGRVRQHWQTSSDGGATWSTAFDGQYHPVRAAAVPATGFLAQLTGGWIGPGTLQGRPTHVELTLTPVLDGRLTRLQWVSVPQGEARGLFEGEALYEAQGPDAYTAQWWDSQAGRHAVRASLAGQALTALWGDKGRTVYSLQADGALEVVDSVRGKDGAWSEFARATLRRK